MRTTIAMDDQTLTHMLGFLTQEQWASAIRHNEVNKDKAMELLQIQDNVYGSPIKSGVEELLAMSDEDFSEHMRFYNRHKE